MSDEQIKENPQIRIQGSNRYDNFTLLGALQQKVIFELQLKNVQITLICLIVHQMKKLIYIQVNSFYCQFIYNFYTLNWQNEEYIRMLIIQKLPTFITHRPFINLIRNQMLHLIRKLKIAIWLHFIKYIKIYYQYSQSFLEYNPFYFFSQQVQYEGVEYQKTVIDSVLYFYDTNTLARIEVHLDAKKKVNFITYQTLMDVVAKLGGLFTIIKALWDFLLLPIQTTLYKIFLIRFFITHTKGNSQVVLKKDSQLKDMSITKLICSSTSREQFKKQSNLINKYLDVKFTQRIEGLQDSINKFDLFSSRQNKLVSKQGEDELLMEKNNEEYINSKSVSFGTINSEHKREHQNCGIIPKLQVKIH